MKILFLGHTTGNGGAAISLTTNLRYLIETEQLDPKECLIAVPHNERNWWGGPYWWFKDKIPFRFWFMPFSVAEKGGSKRLRSKLYSIVKETISIILFTGVYNHSIRKEKVTHIHLNSFVFWSLLPFLPKEIIKIIHVREMLSDDFSGRYAARIINRYADKIITISAQCAEKLPTAIICENPYDMYRARQYRNVRNELKSRIGLRENPFIISVIAPIGKQKGYEFLVKVIERTPEIMFVIIGKPYRDGQNLYRQLRKFPNVRIYPGGDEMDKFYAITDIVLRCEEYLPLGRTVFEGIYAGCITVFPVNDTDKTREIDKYLGEQIFLYPAGDAMACGSLLRALPHQYPDGVYDNGFEPTTNVSVSAHNLRRALI